MSGKLSESERAFLWKRYEHEVSLHRGYMDLAIKLTMFSYAVTGAILSYYLSNIGDPFLKFSLLLPMVMCFCLFLFFLLSAVSTNVTNDEIKIVCNALDLSVYSIIARVLAFLLYIFSIMMFFTFLGLVIVFFKDSGFSCLFESWVK
ncbi:MAG: hypothetical protein ACRBDI_09115 [Alphaproteobacteria bacterium]